MNEMRINFYPLCHVHYTQMTNITIKLRSSLHTQHRTFQTCILKDDLEFINNVRTSKLFNSLFLMCLFVM